MVIVALAVLQTPDELFLDYELVAATDFPWYSPVDPTARDRLYADATAGILDRSISDG